jgi:NTP pyrophosphatase (non-canonical NTP hydrolase)
MNLSDLQAQLRHFAAERDWQPFHAPKNLSTALMVEAAELAEIFQWMSPEESRSAHLNWLSRQRIADEAADVLLYLLQLADHCKIDIAQAVRDKIAHNALKYPAKHTIARAPSDRVSPADTHVLLDYENVQPTEAELRDMVPDANQVWVFHGPHQRQLEQRFASFGSDVTPVLISKTGKNALDFHLSFYMGYIASRNPGAAMVVVANDKGYEPMLEHAKAMGFAVRQLGHRQPKAGGSAKPTPAANPSPTRSTAANKVPGKKIASGEPVLKQVPAKKAAAKKVTVTEQVKAPVAAKRIMAAAARKVSKPALPSVGKKVAPAPPAATGSARLMAKSWSPDALSIKKLSESLRKMADKRPSKPKSLWRSLKSFLGGKVSEEAVQHALARLIEDGVVKMDSDSSVSYPKFGTKIAPVVASA